MARATWNGTVLAESDEVRVVEGNPYFPPGSVDRRYLRESDTRTRCPWKGVARYYHAVVGDAVNRDAAWCYPDTTEKAKHIEGYFAFWRGVAVSLEN